MKKCYGLIYVMINNIDGKCYVGQSIDYQSRLKQYKKMNCHSQKKLYNAFKKHGWNNFSHEIIEIISGGQLSLNLAEIRWIKHLCVVEFGYNLSYGEKTTGKHSEETRQKMRENHADFSGQNHPMWGKRGTLSPIFGRKAPAHVMESIKKAITGAPKTEKTKKLLKTSEYHLKKSKSIKCKETGDVFISLNEACRELNLNKRSLQRHLKKDPRNPRVNKLTFVYE